MTLFHRDTTFSQTDCPKPLSRKKLRQLRWHHPAETSSSWLEQLLGRKRGKAHRSGARKQHIEAIGQLADGTKYTLTKQAPLTLMERMASTFKTALGKFQRAQKRGGQA
jgi:hypothetical protein